MTSLPRLARSDEGAHRKRRDGLEDVVPLGDADFRSRYPDLALRAGKGMQDAKLGVS